MKTAVVLLALLSLIFAAYGFAMAFLYPAGGFFLVWVMLGAVLLAFAWAVRTGRWSRLPAWVRRGACALGLAVMLGVGSLSALIMSAASSVAPPGLDYVIVLGAGLRPDGTPSEALRFRLDAALAYLEENEGTTCVVTGGQGFGEVRTEASSMAEYLRGRGLDAGRIVLEERATTTDENLEYSMALIEGDAEEPIAAGHVSVGIVTNDFHLYRALAAARTYGLTGACGIAASSNPLYLPQSLLRECAAVVRDALLGRAA